MLFGRKDKKKGKANERPEEPSRKEPAVQPKKATEAIQALSEAGQKTEQKDGVRIHRILEEAGLVEGKKGVGSPVPEEEAQRAKAGEPPAVGVRRSEEEMLRLLAEQVGMRT